MVTYNKSSYVDIDHFIEDAKKYLRHLDSVPRRPGECLRYHMSWKGVTIEDLAFRSDVSVRTINRYRKGDMRKPSVLLKICIGMHLEPFFAWDLFAKAGFNLNSQRFFLEKYICCYLSDRSMEDVRKFVRYMKACEA